MATPTTANFPGIQANASYNDARTIEQFDDTLRRTPQPALHSGTILRFKKAEPAAAGVPRPTDGY
ncbi:hypothetical protein [Krasilnikovia sp. MM14-A1004]|uniref:hypothetical protein n=1 Tax=Krasilnikovia sp. MM14-A1004 TaxID=3373541 RepID=UPI00399C6E76